MTLQDYFIDNIQLQNQWAYSKNPQSPESLSPHSHTRAWWRCQHGHEWRARVDSVVSGTSCPYCSGRLPIPGQTDLATTHPQLLRLWSEMNTIRPSQVTSGSQKSVWWVCDKGHNWQAEIVAVAVLGTLCPYCAGKLAIPGETDLATLHPDIMQQWDAEKNASIDPTALLPSSHEKAWWKCQLGHSWQAAVFSRTRKKVAGCPYCAGKKVLPGFNDLATLKPNVAGEWHPGLNGVLRPEDVTLGSNKKVWWQCADGHVWQAAIYSRTRQKGTGCPVCAGMVKAPAPQQAQKKLQSRPASEHRARV